MNKKESDYSGLSAIVEKHLRKSFSVFEEDFSALGVYAHVLKEVERPLITIALEISKGNQVKAAEFLGINRNTLRKKIRELGIKVERE